MVYVFALVGLAMGFGVGLGTINVLLRHRSKREIEQNSSLRWYGLVVWIFAAMGCFLGLWIYNYNFL